jgi:hypothetical protein
MMVAAGHDEQTERQGYTIMKLNFHLFGADVTLIDTTPPILDEQDLAVAKQNYTQAKTSGDTKATWEAGNRLFDNGYVLHGQQWVPGRRLR